MLLLSINNNNKLLFFYLYKETILCCGFIKLMSVQVHTTSGASYCTNESIWKKKSTPKNNSSLLEKFSLVDFEQVIIS